MQAGTSVVISRDIKPQSTLSTLGALRALGALGALGAPKAGSTHGSLS